MLKTAEKNLYWTVVNDCLKEIFGLKETEARARSRRLRSAIDKTRPKRFADIFYHAEPLDVAADLAGKDEKKLKAADWKRYQAILDLHNW